MTLIASIAATLVCAGECSDRTGIRWVLPFEKATAAASEQQRLLLIKPIAFGTEKSGGW